MVYSNKNKTPHVVILGAGFAGMYAYRKLCQMRNDQEFTVTIINGDDHFLFTPLLHEVATGALTAHNIVEPVRHLMRPEDTFCQSTILSINTDAHIVKTSTGEHHYDYLLYALGAHTQFFSTPGAHDFGYELKDLDGALRIREEIVARFELATNKKDEQERRDLLTFTVVGGGATGVELAAELAEFTFDTLVPYYKNISRNDVTLRLIHSGDELLKQFAPSLRSHAHDVLDKNRVEIILETKVAEVGEHFVFLDDGRRLPSEMTLWVAGVAASVIPMHPKPKIQGGRLVVSDSLELDGAENVFVAGDAAHVAHAGERGYPMLAQVASQAGDHVARMILRKIKGQSVKAFTYRSRGSLVSLGQWNALGFVGGLRVTGRAAWFLWRTVYFSKFFSWRKKLKIALEWTVNIFFPRDITRI